MIIDQSLLDDLLAKAADNPRLRVNFDLRTSPSDSSQRMLNAILPGSVIPIHRHTQSTEVVCVLRGRCIQHLYDPAGHEVEQVLLAAAGSCYATPASVPCPDSQASPADGTCQTDRPSLADVPCQASQPSPADGPCPVDQPSLADGSCPAMSVEAGQWHSLEVFEPTVIFEAKDRPYGADGSETL